jgi:hypothetical protein
MGLTGDTGIKRPRVLGVAFCLSHTSILQDDASGVFEKGALSVSEIGHGRSVSAQGNTTELSRKT